jgi:tetratricopeptide (TPR) repeat protein
VTDQNRMIHVNPARLLRLASLFALLPLCVPAAARPAAPPVAAIGPAAGAQDANKDIVQLKSGATEVGRIKSEDFEGLELDPQRGETKRIPWSEIAPGGVTYAAPEWQAAKDLIDQSKFAEALVALEPLKADTKLRDPVRQNVLYFNAFALQRGGQLDAALAGYQELLTAFPTSRYLLEVGEALVAIHVAKKDVAGAARALDKLSADAVAAGAGAAFNASLNVVKGRVLEEQKDWAKARAAYTVAAGASGIPPAVQMQAELGLGRCAVALNQKSEAEAAFRKLAGKDGPAPVMAGAWNGLGDLTLESGRAANGGKGDAEQILDALYMYLRGVVQYSPLPGQPSDEYERALAGSAVCFKYLSQLESVADRKRLYGERAAQRAAQLKREYPNSKHIKDL